MGYYCTNADTCDDVIPRIKEIMNTPNKKISYKLALLKFQKEIRALFLTSSFIKKNR